MTDERITAYLLGELPDEESERFEEECFVSESWPEEINLAEEDLIDAYLRRELVPEQHQHFEQNYLTTEARRKRVAAAAALLTYVDTFRAVKAPAAQSFKPSWIERFTAFWGHQNWALRAGLTVGVIVVLIGALWLSRPRTAPPKGLATLTLTMTAESRRDEGTRPQRVSLLPETGVLRISLKLPEESAQSPRYRVEMVTVEGETSSPEVVGQDGASLFVEVPAAQLMRSQYALKLFAINSDGTERRISGSYFFIVE